MVHPTKRGTKINASYKVVETTCEAGLDRIDREVGLLLSHAEPRMAQEGRKISVAIKQWQVAELERMRLELEAQWRKREASNQRKRVSASRSTLRPVLGKRR